jgi:hypothetical protein
MTRQQRNDPHREHPKTREKARRLRQLARKASEIPLAPPSRAAAGSTLDKDAIEAALGASCCLAVMASSAAPF